MRDRAAYFSKNPRQVLARMSLSARIQFPDTRFYGYIEQRTALSVSSAIAIIPERRLTRLLLDSAEVFPELCSWIGLGFNQCLFMVDVPTRVLIPEWGSAIPGDLDVVILPRVGGKLSVEFIVAVQVKRIVVDSEGKYRINETGTRQSLATAECGVDLSILLYLVIQEPAYPKNGVACLQSSFPRVESRMKLLELPQIQHLRRKPVVVATAEIGHLPGVAMEQALGTTFDATPPVLIRWFDDRNLMRHRAEMQANIRAGWFHASNAGLYGQDQPRLSRFLFFRKGHGWTLVSRAIECW